MFLLVDFFYSCGNVAVCEALRGIVYQIKDLVMNENDIAKVVVDAAYRIHKQLGPGLFESVYLLVLYHDLLKRGLKVEKEVPVRISFDGLQFDEGFRADLIVESLLIIEVKSVSTIHPVHKKQLLTYLRLTSKRLGLLINFGESLIKDGIVRVVNGLPDNLGK